jgi:carboxypeptidase Taq
MEKVEIKNPIIIKILEKYKTLWALNHLSALANWDMQTYMPKEGSHARGEALGKLSALSQRLFLEKEFVKLIEKGKNEKDLSDYEKGILRILLRQLKFYRKLPSEFLEEFARAAVEGHTMWEMAKKKNDFSVFLPSLTKIVELVKRRAEYLGYEKHPYDALLDEFEEELKVEEVEKYFEYIKPRLAKLLNFIKSSSKFKESHKLNEEPYEIEEMKKLNEEVLSFIHYNSEHLRIDVSMHPFTSFIGKGDFRITTRYQDRDFGDSFSSTMHEYGHALYDLQSHDDLHFTPISGGTSMVIHESQSRFWENFIGKSKTFIELFENKIKRLSYNISKHSVDEIYIYLNNVKPSLIRTKADELTYHFHIIIRFEIEKELLEGKINVKNLKKIWNEKYEKYLGIEPKNDSEGILQDIHWSEGLFGYFSTYSIGTALSAMWKCRLEKDIGKIEDLLKTKEGIRKIQDWLKERIHQYGSAYTFNELVKKTTGENFSAKYLIDYLKDKYEKIYGS